MIPRTLDSTLDEIFKRVDRMEVFADLDPKDVGKYVLCRCPGCGQKSAFCYKNGVMLKCNRGNNCGHEVPILTHLNGGTKPAGPRFIELVKQLGERLSIPVPERFCSEEAAEAARAAAEKVEKLEAALATAHQSITKSAIEYLERRGFRAPGAALSSDIGFISNDDVAIALGGYDGTEDKQPWRKWVNRIVFAIRNRHGRLVGAVARGLGDDEPKYINSKGMQMSSLGAIGLDQALANGNATVILVESIMEVHLARSHGHSAFVALGGAGNMGGPERLRALYDLGVRKLYTLMDNDGAGKKGVDHMVNAFTDSKMPEIYVPDIAAAFGECKDLAEVAQTKHSIDSVVAKLASSDHAYRYKARQLAQNFDLTHDEAKSAYAKVCYKFDSTIFDPVREDDLDAYFWTEVCRLTGRDMDYLLDVRDDVKRTELYERQQKSIEENIRRAHEAFTRGDASVVDALANAYRTACEQKSETVFQPIVPLSERLADNTARLAKRSGQQYLGLIQNSLPELNEATLGLRKMITVASGPGVGKTIFIAQLVQDVLVANDDACAVLVSWELTGDEIIDRMKSRMLNLKWSDLQLHSTPEQRDQADALLAPIADRMVIIEGSNCAEKELTAEKIIKEADTLKRQTGCKRCIVAVDYLQIFPVPDEVANSRTDIGRDDYIVKEMKKVRYYLGDDPLLLISEVNKNSGAMGGKGLEKIKGSGRVPYSSDAVFFLNPLTDEELVKVCQFHNGVAVPVGRYATAPEVDKKSVAKTAAAIRASLLEQGKDYVELYIGKIRDGGKRATILLTNNYELSRMESGIK